jgi:uncharacterized protein (DUF58 family)
VPPVELGYADPFRLVSRVRRRGDRSVVWVYPLTRWVVPLPGRVSDSVDATASVYSSPRGTSFHSLREYRDGDDWRLIHWPSTARTGELVVRQNALPDETRHLVVLDTRAASYPDGETFEDAVRFAASWCEAATAAGHPLTVATTAGRVAAGRSGGGRADAGIGTGIGASPGDMGPLDLLADVHRAAGDPGLGRLRSIVPRSGNTAIGIVTGAPEPSTLAVLPALAQAATSVSLVRLGDPRRSAPVPVPVPAKITSVVAADLDTAVARWNAAARR